MKTATTIEEQIGKLRKRGVIITDEQKAKEILLDIGYYRLGFYLFPFEKTYPVLFNRQHEYKDSTALEYAVALYYLDFDLRHILTRYLTRIEIALRTAIIYNISNKYKRSPTWFADKTVMKSDYVDDFQDNYYSGLRKKVIIARHHNKYINELFAPAWKTIEFMTLGELNVLYQNFKFVDDKRLISKRFGVNNTFVFENYLETIRVVRNLCAHGNVLFDLKLSRSVKNGPAYCTDGVNGHDLGAALSVISYLLKQVSANREKDMQDDIEKAINKAQAKFPNVKDLLWCKNKKGY